MVRKLNFLRTLARVMRSDTECWIWDGRIGPNGYPFIGDDPAYRRVYRFIVDDIPAGYEIDHLCGNPLCVNPLHLQAVPPAVNKWRSNSPSAVNGDKKCCIRGHPFSKANTLIQIKKGRECRRCRLCHAASVRLYNWRLKHGRDAK